MCFCQIAPADSESAFIFGFGIFFVLFSDFYKLSTTVTWLNIANFAISHLNFRFIIIF